MSCPRKRGIQCPARLDWTVGLAKHRIIQTIAAMTGTSLMRLPREIGPIHFVGIGGIGMSGIAEVLVQSRLHRAGLGRLRERQCHAAARQGRQGHRRPQGRERRRRRRGRGLDRDQARQSGTDGGARAAHSGGAPRRNAGRTDAAEKLRRDRRHPWQDHHDLDGRNPARCRRSRSDRDQWRHHQCLRHQCPARRRRLDGGGGRRERRHVPEAAGRCRHRHQYRSRASRSLQDLRGDAGRVPQLSSRTCRSTALP